jgi:hypothetical protein
LAQEIRDNPYASDHTPLLPSPTPAPPGSERAHSVASSSHTVERSRGGLGSGRPVVVSSDESDEEDDEDEDTDASIDVGETTTPARLRRRNPAPKKKKHSRAAEMASTPRPTKRLRMRGPSSLMPSTPVAAPAPAPAHKLKLLPPRRKRGQDGEEESEEVRKGMFDDILDEEERSTKVTVVVAGDKVRFESSRQRAEVRHSSTCLSQMLTNIRSESYPPSYPGLIGSRPFKSATAFAPDTRSVNLFPYLSWSWCITCAIDTYTERYKGEEEGDASYGRESPAPDTEDPIWRIRHHDLV